MPKVSLIIPVYNAQATIVRCLDSVLAQTLEDIEVVLVDDHGADGSITIAKKHLADYKGVKHFCFTQTPVNSGPGAARNIGLTQATGDYVAFVDSDDTLEPTYCAAMYEAAVNADADLVCCQATMHSGDSRTLLTNPVFPAGTLDSKQRSRILRSMVTYLWTYLFRRELISTCKIAFPPMRSAEDSCFVLSCWLSARSAASLEIPLYNYYVMEGSVSRLRDPGRAKQRLGSFRALKAFAKASGLWRPHRWTLRWVIFKKGWLLAAKDYIIG